MVVALLLDHFGLLGLPVKHITNGRAIGVFLMIAGLLVIQANNESRPVNETIAASRSAK